MKAILAVARALAHSLSPFASLFVRLGVGLVFLHHGAAKLHLGIAGVAGFLGHLGIPIPEVAAIVVIAVETLGAACVVVGLLTRFWAAGMAVEMVVAILVALLPAHRTPELEGLLLAGALALVGMGAGPISLDRLFGKKA
jgi:putative oxidoreductase